MTFYTRLVSEFVSNFGGSRLLHQFVPHFDTMMAELQSPESPSSFLPSAAVPESGAKPDMPPQAEVVSVLRWAKSKSTSPCSLEVL
jgi:hypothetical protein